MLSQHLRFWTCCRIGGSPDWQTKVIIMHNPLRYDKAENQMMLDEFIYIRHFDSSLRVGLSSFEEVINHHNINRCPFGCERSDWPEAMKICWQFAYEFGMHLVSMVMLCICHRICIEVVDSSYANSKFWPWLVGPTSSTMGFFKHFLSFPFWEVAK